MSASSVPLYGKIRRDIANQLSFKALGVLAKITANINLHTNSFECSLNGMAKLLECSVPTVVKFTSDLEKAGYIRVTRKGGGKHHDVNIYHLAGKHAETALTHNKNIDTTSKEIEDHVSKNLTPAIKKFDTDYIDSNDSILEEEDLNQLSENLPQSDSGEYDVPGEGEDPTLPEQDAPLRRLEILGITGAALEAAEQYPDRIDAAFKLVAQKENIRDLAGYISRVLINGIYAEVSQTDQNRQFEHEKQPEFASLTWTDLANDSVIADAAAQNAYFAAESQQEDTLDAKNWKIAFNQLECQIDRATFETFFKHTDYWYTDTDGTFVITVHNPYAKDYLQHRLYRNVRRVLSDVRGKQTECRFVVASEVNTS